MQQKEEQQRARVWLNVGAGDPPLLWPIKYWPSAVSECGFLTAQQYWHVADQLKDMASHEDPAQCPTLDIAKFEDCWELKDKGGPLGKINLRVFFLVNTKPREIVVLGVHKKEDEGLLRQSVVVRIERRHRLYLLSLLP